MRIWLTISVVYFISTGAAAEPKSTPKIFADCYGSPCYDNLFLSALYLHMNKAQDDQLALWRLTWGDKDTEKFTDLSVRKLDEEFEKNRTQWATQSKEIIKAYVDFLENNESCFDLDSPRYQTKFKSFAIELNEGRDCGSNPVNWREGGGCIPPGERTTFCNGGFLGLYSSQKSNDFSKFIKQKSKEFSQEDYQSVGLCLNYLGSKGIAAGFEEIKGSYSSKGYLVLKGLSEKQKDVADKSGLGTKICFSGKLTSNSIDPGRAVPGLGGRYRPFLIYPSKVELRLE